MHRHVMAQPRLSQGHQTPSALGPDSGSTPPFDFEGHVDRLRRTPRVLHNLLGGSPFDVTASDEPLANTISTLVEQLVRAERFHWIPCARQILSGRVAPITEALVRSGHATASMDSLHARLAEFQHLRTASLTTLCRWRLTEGHLAREGTHHEFGHITLRQLLTLWLAHDLEYTVLVARTIGRSLQHDVGPWGAYLSVTAP